ncbi:MAG: hypothetical protein ACK54C_04980 [Betaproteobacteria bacterium]
MIALLLGLTAAGGATAQKAPLLDDRFTLSAGGYLLQTDLRARLDGRSLRNPNVDFDEDLGVGKDASGYRIDGLWRITPRHHLQFMYFDNSNDSRRTISEDIRWGDTTYQAGATIDAEAKFKIFQLAFEYAFLRSRSCEIAGTIGEHYIDLSLKLAGTASIVDSNGNVVSRQFESRQSSVPAPLPVFGLRGRWEMAPDFYLDGLAQYFRVSVDILDGALYDLRAGGTYMFTQNFGVGLGYNHFKTTVDVSRSAFNGRVELGYSGLMLYLTGSL